MNTIELAPDNPTKGNIGLYYVCYQLSSWGWNCLPTAKNARGIDILIYSQDARQRKTIQVKARSKPTRIDLGSNLDDVMADFWIICLLDQAPPRCFVLKLEDVRKLAQRGEIDGEYYLQPRDYRADVFEEKWERVGKALIELEIPEGRPTEIKRAL